MEHEKIFSEMCDDEARLDKAHFSHIHVTELFAFQSAHV